MGADNPDNHYMNASISGAHEYVIHGHRGTVKYLAFATQSGHYGRGGGMPPLGRSLRTNSNSSPTGASSYT
jgi:hypothetical protein